MSKDSLGLRAHIKFFTGALDHRNKRYSAGGWAVSCHCDRLGYRQMVDAEITRNSQTSSRVGSDEDRVSVFWRRAILGSSTGSAWTEDDRPALHLTQDQCGASWHGGNYLMRGVRIQRDAAVGRRDADVAGQQPLSFFSFAI